MLLIAFYASIDTADTFCGSWDWVDYEGLGSQSVSEWLKNSGQDIKLKIIKFLDRKFTIGSENLARILLIHNDQIVKQWSDSNGDFDFLDNNIIKD